MTLPAEEAPWCYGGPESGGTEGRCTFSTTVGDVWLSGVVGVVADGPGTAAEAVAVVSARVAEAAAAAPHFVPPTRPDGAWSSAAECSAVDSALADALGGAYSAEIGNGPGESPAGLSAAFAAAGGALCMWRDAAAGTIFSGGMLPAAGWAVEWLTSEGADPISVDGALAAVAVGGDRDGISVGAAGVDATTVYATDGVNLAWAMASLGADREQAAAVAGAALATGAH